jgi:glucokinase
VVPNDNEKGREARMMGNQADNRMVSIQMPEEGFYQRILSLLYKQKELPIDEISKITGAEITDLSVIIDFLEARGFVLQQIAAGAYQKRIVSLREGENCIIGLDLGGSKLYGAISDLGGNILADHEIRNHGKSGEACFEMLADLIEQLVHEASQRDLNLKGIGVDVPGRVQLETGFVWNAPAVGLKDFPLKERLVTRFGYPVFIDNDLKQASLGEAWFGEGKNFHHVVLLAIGTGIAASTVINGNPLRGAHSRQGELGWMVPGREFLGRKYVGFGALETEVSGPGIERRAKRLFRERGDGAISDGIQAEYVFTAAKDGQVWAQQCVAETVEFLAVLVANIIAFYDPDIIILSGGVSRSSEMLIPPILKLVEGCVLTQPHLVASSLGYKAGALGAIVNLTQNCPEIFR